MLARDLPEQRLKRGDIVKLVEHHVAPDRTKGYIAEVSNALSDTLAIITVPDSALEPLREDEVLCGWVMAATRARGSLCDDLGGRPCPDGG